MGSDHDNVIGSGVKTHRVELTAISVASLVAVLRTSNSCISTVGRNLIMTLVSMACRH